MDENRFNSFVQMLREQEGVEEVFVLNSEGDVLFKSQDFFLTNEESKKILTAWKEKEPA